MKKKIIITSILSILVCACLIAGSTYALFTSEDRVDFTVTSATVDISATVENIVYSSTLGSTLAGSSADFDDTENTITLENIVPGDYVTFNIVIKNNSNVAVQYRTKILKVSDNGLWDGLTVEIDNAAYDGTDKVTTWAPMTISGSETIVVPVKIALAEDKGNEFQGKTLKLAYVVEAAQGNADMPNT